MVQSKNELIRIIRQIIGHEEVDGFYTYTEYNNEIIKVPNYLFKDAPAEYPEIRISPFLEEEKITHSIKKQRYNHNNKIIPYRTKFQIDIFSTNLVELNQIYDSVFRRIDLARDIETIKYGYNNDFVEISPNLYLNKIITNKNYHIADISIGYQKINVITEKQDLQKNNVYLLNEEGLFIHTSLNIKNIRMRSIINGLLLPDGNTIYQKGIISLNISDKVMLSDLKRNNVERISFMLNIDYSMDNLRKSGPIATHVIIK